MNPLAWVAIFVTVLTKITWYKPASNFVRGKECIEKKKFIASESQRFVAETRCMM